MTVRGCSLGADMSAQEMLIRAIKAIFRPKMSKLSDQKHRHP